MIGLGSCHSVAAVRVLLRANLVGNLVAKVVLASVVADAVTAGCVGEIEQAINAPNPPGPDTIECTVSNNFATAFKPACPVAAAVVCLIGTIDVGARVCIWLHLP